MEFSNKKKIKKVVHCYEKFNNIFTIIFCETTQSHCICVHLIATKFGPINEYMHATLFSKGFMVGKRSKCCVRIPALAATFKLQSIIYLRLCKLVIMMRKFQIHSTSVNVNGTAQHLTKINHNILSISSHVINLD